MAVTDQQKLDFLLKKIGYTKTKTGSVVGTGAISGTPKQPFAEAIPSPLVVPNSSLWNEAASIPATPPGSDTAQVKVYLAASSGLRMTADSTSSGQRAYIAYSTYGNASSTRLTNWIDTQFGSAYLIKVYKGDPNSGGVALSAAGSGANDGWFFDYSAGVLNFNDTSVPSGVTDTNIYIVGYRYIGQTGAPTSGISTFSHLDLTVERNLDVGKQGGISTFRNNIDANGIIEGIAGENKIPSLYSNMGALPSAGSYHGMFAHVHATGRGYFAHAGNWLELVNKEINGVVGTGTESYNLGTLSVTGNVSIGGTLTYEDVKNVDSVGLGTFREGIFIPDNKKLELGNAAGSGDIRLYSNSSNANTYLESYSGSFSIINKTNNTMYINSNYLDFKTQNYGKRYIYASQNSSVDLYFDNVKKFNTASSGINVVGTTTTGQLAVTGVSTFTGNIDANGDLDVDGHTNLDNVSIAGVVTATTFVGNGDFVELDVDGHTNLDNVSVSGVTTFGGNATFAANGYFTTTSGITIENSQPGILFSDTTANPDFAIQNRDGSFAIRDTTSAANRFLVNMANGDVTVTGDIDVSGDLDVDGHTNLDNVSIAGVTSVASLTSGRVVTAGTGGKLQDSNNLTFDGTNLFVSGINVTGGGSTSTLGADIVTRNFKATGLSTFVGQSEFDGNAKFDSTITAGGSAGSNGQYLKTTGSGVEWASFPTLRTRQTFTASAGQTAFSFSYTINFIDVFVNGIKLTDAEFTATNGSTVVLAVGCFVGDIVELVSYNTVSGGGGGGGGGISNVVEDTTPQLGGNLDLFNKSITGTGNVNITGIISATSFKGPSGVTATFIGDGSGLTNVIGSGSGVVVKDDDNVVGTAGTINFGQNLSVTPISAGIVTVGVSSASLDINKLTVTGITTFVGITTFTNEVSFHPPLYGKVNFYGSVVGQRLRWQNNGSNVGLYFNDGVASYYGSDNRTKIEPHGNGGSADHFRFWQYRPDGKENQLMIDSDFIRINGAHYNSHQSRDIARINYHDGTSFYHFGNKKFQTSGVGVTITSQLDVTNINASGVTTTTEVRSNALSLKNAAGSATYATFSNGGASVLKWNNTDRLETTTSGVTVTGTVAATSYTGDGSQLTGIGAGSTANIITNNLQVLGISTFQGHVQTGTGATVGIGSTAYVHKIAFKEAGSVNNSLTAALGNTGGSLTFTGGGVQNGVWGNSGLKIAGNGASTTTGPEANCTLEVVSSQNTRVLFKGSANTGLDFDSSSPNNGVANYIRSDKDFIFYTGFGSSAGVSTNFKIGQKEGSTFYSSVGIRTNYYPLGAVSISMDAISGIVTATKFVGDGSQLTNLPGGGSYGNNDVDNHLNVSNASTGQILSWNGSDYAWVNDQTGGGGGGTDVGITTNLSGSFTASAGTPATINTFSYHDNDKVVEYTVYIKNGSDFQSQKLLAMRDGATIHSTQFAVMFSSSLLVQCDATISSGNILLRATPETGVSGSTTYKIKREVM